MKSTSVRPENHNTCGSLTQLYKVDSEPVSGTSAVVKPIYHHISGEGREEKWNFKDVIVDGIIVWGLRHRSQHFKSRRIKGVSESDPIAAQCHKQWTDSKSICQCKWMMIHECLQRLRDEVTILVSSASSGSWQWLFLCGMYCRLDWHPIFTWGRLHSRLRFICNTRLLGDSPQTIVG